MKNMRRTIGTVRKRPNGCYSCALQLYENSPELHCERSTLHDVLEAAFELHCYCVADIIAKKGHYYGR